MSTRVERNMKALAGLHPQFEPRVVKLLEACEHEGMKLCIVQGRRTFEEQAALYALGRTADGKIVTQARPGYSFHNYGLAVDVVDFASSGNKDLYEASDFDFTQYAKVGELAAPLGLNWGGAWRTFKDLPHFEFHPGVDSRSAIKLLDHCITPGVLVNDFFDIA